MDNDISQAIIIIDAKIASLQEARNRLASAFGIATSRVTPVAETPLTPTRASVVDVREPLPVANRSDASGRPGGRKEQLAKFLIENGPTSRVGIVERSGIPEGTVSFCLNDKRFFQQVGNGDWDVTDFSRRGFERRAILETPQGGHE